MRNYPAQHSFVLDWLPDEAGNYCFRLDPIAVPKSKSSRDKNKPPLDTYLPAAKAILGSDKMDFAGFKVKLKEATGLSENRSREFITWATDEKNPLLMTEQKRGRGLNKKVIWAS